MHGFVAGDNIAFLQNGIAAVDVADKAAGLAHQERARRKIPGREIAFPIGVEPPCRDPSEIKRRRAVAAQPREGALRGCDFVAGEPEIATPEMRQATGDDSVGEPLPRGDADALVVQKRTLAALGDEHVVIRRIVDETSDDRAVALKRNRDGEMRDAMEEIGGAVERIDDPAMGRVGARMSAAFFAQEAIVWPRFGEFLAHDGLGTMIRGGDKVPWAFHRDLEVLDLAEVALEAATGAMGCLDHDIEDRGMKHGGLS